MPDHRNQHFRLQKLLEVLLFSLPVATLMVCTANYVHADDPLGEQKTSSEKSDLPANSMSEATQRLLETSQYVLEVFDMEGLSSKSIAAQQRLIVDIRALLKQSDPSPSVVNSATNLQGENKNDHQNTFSSQSPGTQNGSSAGQAPTVVATSEFNIGDLSQRENFADAVWGHLPPRERNDLLRTYSESYLPGYEDRVTRYFEKLAKLRRRRPNKSLKEIEHIDSP